MRLKLELHVLLLVQQVVICDTTPAKWDQSAQQKRRQGSARGAHNKENTAGRGHHAGVTRLHRCISPEEASSFHRSRKLWIEGKACGKRGIMLRPIGFPHLRVSASSIPVGNAIDVWRMCLRVTFSPPNTYSYRNKSTGPLSAYPTMMRTASQSCGTL